jgi:hypothetical protein
MRDKKWFVRLGVRIRFKRRADVNRRSGGGGPWKIMPTRAFVHRQSLDWCELTPLRFGDPERTPAESAGSSRLLDDNLCRRFALLPRRRVASARWTDQRRHRPPAGKRFQSFTNPFCCWITSESFPDDPSSATLCGGILNASHWRAACSQSSINQPIKAERDKPARNWACFKKVS